MRSVLILTTAGPLSDEISMAASLAISQTGAGPYKAHRLADDAVEITFTGEMKPALEAAREHFAGAPIDVNAVPEEGRRKRLLISDMDGPIITVECIDEIAAHAGIGERVAAITERAMRGELDFNDALRERVGLLKGFAEADLQAVYDQRVKMTPGAKALVTGMKQAGALTALISGGFDFFTERVAAAAGFERHQANRLIFADGRLTGDVAMPILGREAKQEALLALAAEIDAKPEETLALGDGANDLGMIGVAGLGVAWRAKPAVAAAADARIDHADLTAVLRLQGIPAQGF